MCDLANRSIIVTGSTSGIGRRIAEQALGEGALVMITSRSRERVDKAVSELESSFPGNVAGMVGDLREEGFAVELVEHTVNRFGQLDGVVNNAGGTFHAPAEEISAKGWRAVVDTNLTSTFLVSKAAFQRMRNSSRPGVIVNIASIAPYMGFVGGAHYAAAKAGVIALTRTLAAEWGKHDIRLHCLAVGNVFTELSSFWDDEVRRDVEQWVPRGEIGRPEEIAEVVVMLMKLKTSFLNGETILLDGSAAHVPHARRDRPRGMVSR